MPELGTNPTSTIRVLAVDDDQLVLDLVSRALGGAEFEVAVAHSTDEIAGVASGFTPHVVLVDVNLPGTPSGAAIEAVRASVPREARVLLFSSHDDGVLRTLARRVGADGWLSKSTSIVDLGARIRSYVGR